MREVAGWGRVLAVTAALAVAGGCSTFKLGCDDSPTAAVELIAVYPIREVPSAEDGTAERPILDTHAGRAVTAQIYGWLSEQVRYRFVPDLTVEEFVDEISAPDPVEAARQLARASGAGAVLFGAVYRFQDRVGTRYAASQPASVSFDLALYTTAADAVVWTGQFDRTQRALSSNFLDIWMFWRAGPHWFSSRELARLGVEKLLAEID